jgi:hypothetical protein
MTTAKVGTDIEKFVSDVRHLTLEFYYDIIENVDRLEVSFYRS